MSIKYKKPWLFAEYLDMMKTVDEAEVYNEGVNEKQSEFKKPYKHPTHPHSENEFSGPGWGGPGGIKWPIGGSWPGADCTPRGSAIGGGALNPCQPGLSCGQWAWTCAHKITKFSVVQGNGFIQSITYGANDTVTVTVCWDESFGAGKIVGSLVETASGAVFKSTVPLDCLGPGHDPACTNCADCGGSQHEPTIGYTTKQMNVSGSQVLTTTGGGGGPYTWSIIAGAGSLSGGSGTSVTYTAPATNSNCANNPTIQVKDFCGNKKTLKLAVNQFIGGGPALGYSYVSESGTCAVTIRARAFECDGSINAICADVSCCSCNLEGYENCAWTGLVCTGATCPAPGGGCWTPSGDCIAYCLCFRSFPSTPGYHDIRTAGEIAGGCCPQQLL